MKARDYYLQGLSKKDKHEYLTAIDDFKEAILLDNNFIEAYEEFLKLVGRIDINGVQGSDIENMPEYAFRLGVLYQAKGKIAESITQFKDARLRGSERYSIECNIDQMLDSKDLNFWPKKALPSAIYAFNKFIEMHPERVLPYYNLALVYQKNNQPDQALIALTQVKNIMPAYASHSFFQIALGNIYLSLAQTENAEASFRNALGLEPTVEEASKSHLELALIYQKMKQSDKTKFHKDACTKGIGQQSALIYQSIFHSTEEQISKLSANQKSQIQELRATITANKLTAELKSEAFTELGDIYTSLSACLKVDSTQSDLTAAIQKITNIKYIPNDVAVSKILKEVKINLNELGSSAQTSSSSSP